MKHKLLFLLLTICSAVAFIGCSKDEAPYLTLSQEKFEIPMEGGEFTVQVSTNCLVEPYTDQCRDEYGRIWVKLLEASQAKDGTVSALRFRVEPSEEYTTRQGTIVINGQVSASISVYQNGGGLLVLSQKEYTLSNQAQELTIDLSSNFAYEVDIPQNDWVTLVNKGTRALMPSKISLQILENTSYDDRTVVITVYDKNSDKSEQIKITQCQKDVITLDCKEITMQEEGGQFTVKIGSNVEYAVEVDQPWLHEITSASRALVEHSHSFSVEPITEGGNREAKISFIDKKSGTREEILVKQERKLYFKEKSFVFIEGSSKNLEYSNTTGKNLIWSSSDRTVATVDATGLVKALAKGETQITVTTEDGSHNASCILTVHDITDFIKVECLYLSGSLMNNLIQYGSALGWKFSNNSNETVKFLSMQLIDGETGKEGNIMDVNVDVAPGESASYSTRVGLLGITLPVTCVFRYEYNGKEYKANAVFDGKHW